MSDVQKKDPIQGDIIHEYDGIEEADNGIPHWLSFIFYAAIVFAVGYWFYYHEYQVGLLPKAKYTAQMEAEADKGGEVSAELLTSLADDSSVVEQGEQTFQTNCVQCHGPNAGGKIGPNLTDSFWLHGGAPTDIYNTIYNGVLAKGMPSWSGPLDPKGVQQVTAYVLSLRNTNVEGGKEPQGEEYSGSAADLTKREAVTASR